MIPAALGVQDGRFVALDPTTGAATSSELPEACPDTLPDARVNVEHDAAALGPIRVAITVDTEDAYFTSPRLMTGEGIGGAWGVGGILDELAQHEVTATFFVNVFESDRQPAGAVRDVVREIAERGHEVALHSHPAPDLPWYSQPLFWKTRQAQVDIFKRGQSTLQEWSGQPVISFRAGGYAVNDHTFEALSDTGFRIDSSVYFPSPNNRITRFTVNAPRLIGDLVEAPVTYVIRVDGQGDAVEHRKLDFDWLTTSQLIQGMGRLRASAASTAVFMMHSFSFIDKATWPPDHPRSPRARFTSAVVFNRYVEIYGPKPEARGEFGGLLGQLRSDPQIKLGSLVEAESDLRAAADSRARDVIPVLVR